LAEIASRYVEAGKQNRASDLLSQALQVAKDSTSLQVVTLAEISGVYAQAGQYDQALQVTKIIEDAYWKTHVLVEINGKYAHAGQQPDDKARKILHEIVREAG